MGKRAKLKREKIQEEKKERKQIVEKNYREKNPWIYFWRRVDFWIIAVAVLAVCVYPFIPTKYLPKYETEQKQKGTHAILNTSMGDIELAFYGADAPKTVANFEKLANEGFYSNMIWHRVIKDFVIQTGDPSGDGTGGPGYQFDDEINNHKFVVGTVGMANSGANTNGSQFFIIVGKDQSSLDGKYTAFGYVVRGMDVAELIAQTPTDENDKPLTDIKLNSIQIVNE